PEPVFRGPARAVHRDRGADPGIPRPRLRGAAADRRVADLPRRAVPGAAGTDLRRAVGVAGPPPTGSVQAGEAGARAGVRGTVLHSAGVGGAAGGRHRPDGERMVAGTGLDRKSTRLNSSHVKNSYA